MGLSRIPYKTEEIEMGKTRRSRTTNKKLYSDQSPALTEAFNALRTNLAFTSVGNTTSVFVITSAIEGEGKSSVSINTAKALERNGKRVLLIDCDMRKPSLHRYLGVRNPSSTGLSTVLCKESSVSESIIRIEDKNIWFLPAGVIPPNPAELLASNQMSILISGFRDSFDYIICDTPPVNVVTDAAALCAVCDGVILVVRHKYSTREQVHHAKGILETVGAHILGVVYNDYLPTSIHNTYYQDYHYGQTKTQSQTGNKRIK